MVRKATYNPIRYYFTQTTNNPEHRAEFADSSTERLMELRDEYRAGRVKLVEREPDAEVRTRLNAVNGKMLADIEAELEKRMRETG